MAWALLCLPAAAAAVGAPMDALGAAKGSATLSARHRFDIPPQPLSAALRALSVQSGTRILFPYDEVAALRGRSVRGWLSIDRALAQLLAGTPLRYWETEKGVIALGSANQGVAQRGSRSPIRLAQAASCAPAAVGMAARPEAGADMPAAPIIVTGTRQLSRTVAESPSPIDVLGRADLEASGRLSVRDLLGALVPSISVSNGGAGASFAVKTLSLRGLSGDQLLVLVNGKRRHNMATLFINGTTQNGQSPPDLDLIPASAIERIEVLRDGASAQYGSDAIAGVINIITKRDNSGSLTTLGGATGRGDGVVGRIQGDHGFEFGNGGEIHLAIDAYLQERTVRGTANPAMFYGLNDPREPPQDSPARRVNKPGQPQVEGVNLSYDAMLPLGATMELYSVGTASRRRADAWLTFRTPHAANNIPELYPAGYSPHLFIDDDDFQGVIGVRGDLAGDVHVDISSSYARNSARYATTGLNASLGPASPTFIAIGSVRSTEWTSNIDLQHRLDAGFAEPLLVAAGAEYRENGYQIGAGEPASYVDGGYRSPPGSPNAGILRQGGSQGVTGFSPEAAGTFRRHAWSAYLNLEQTVVDGVDVGLAARHEDYSDFGTTDTGKASLRIEPVEGFAIRGTVSTGFRAPTLQQIHYASSSTIGVLLPGATQMTLAPVRALPVGDPVAVAFGAQPLKPERSTNYTLGLVFTPTPRLSITIDAYRIAIDDRILLSGTLTGAADPNGANGLNAIANILLSAGFTPAQAVQSGFYFSNAASTRTRGLDIVGSYRANLGDWGSATVTLSGNFNRTTFTRIEVPPVLAAIGQQLIDRARQGDFTKGTPRDKFVGNLNWRRGGVTLNLRATRYGKVTQVSTLPAHDDVIDPKVLVDAELGLAVGRGVRVAVGANNLFDVYPDILKVANQGVGRFAYYNSYAPYGISGGFYYGKLSFSF